MKVLEHDRRVAYWNNWLNPCCPSCRIGTMKQILEGHHTVAICVHCGFSLYRIFFEEYEESRIKKLADQWGKSRIKNFNG